MGRSFPLIKLIVKSIFYLEPILIYAGSWAKVNLAG